MFVTAIVFIFILAGLIFVHELGHYATARMAGVKVEEFGIGFPPRIFGYKRGETVYSLNWIPLGGFCKLLGEEDPSDPRSLAAKSVPVRLMVLGAGSFMNIMLPFLLLSIAFMVPRQVIVGDVFVEDVAAESPAAVAGFQPGDAILSVAGDDVQNIGDIVYGIHLNLGEETSFTLLGADGTERTVTAVPRWDPPEEQGAVGIQLRMDNLREVSESDPFWRAIPKSFTTVGETFALLRNEVTTWFVRETPPQVTGPVGIFQLTGEVSEAGPSYLLQFAAFLSLNLGLINLFPLPALDGGRIVFVLIEVARRGKRVSPRTEGLVHLVGFVMLITLMLVIGYFDVVRVISGESLVP
jgi:regulator of sigma E protease